MVQIMSMAVLRPNFHFTCHISGICRFPFPTKSIFPYVKDSVPHFFSQPSLRTSTSFSENSVAKERDSVVSSIETIPKVDKSGRLCSLRAARELALSIVYAACLEGFDPVRLFEKRLNARREPGYKFDETSLMEYNHMSFGGPPVTVETAEEADELLRKEEKDSAIEAEILSAPPKMVYNKLMLRFTRKLLVAVGERWDSHVLKIEKVIPPTWKDKPAGRILELCILHLAMSEITVLGTKHPIVINEAVDLAKRFCDGAAPRIINGCLRTFVKDVQEIDSTRAREKLVASRTRDGMKPIRPFNLAKIIPTSRFLERGYGNIVRNTLPKPGEDKNPRPNHHLDTIGRKHLKKVDSIFA